MNQMEMNNIIQVIIPYELAYQSDRLVNELWLNPYAMNEGLIDPSDRLVIDITEDKLWILSRLQDYLII